MSDLAKFDTALAHAIWESDTRPCGWSDLDDDEREEWVTMATAARKFVVKHMMGMVSTNSEGWAIPQRDIQVLLRRAVRNMAADAIKAYE